MEPVLWEEAFSSSPSDHGILLPATSEMLALSHTEDRVAAPGTEQESRSKPKLQNSRQERNKTQPGAGAWTAGAVSMQPQINAFPGTTGSISMAHHSHHPHHHGHPFQTLAFIQNPSLSWALARWPTSHWRYREPTGDVFLHLETLRQSQNRFRPLRISGTCEK